MIHVHDVPGIAFHGSLTFMINILNVDALNYIYLVQCTLITYRSNHSNSRREWFSTIYGITFVCSSATFVSPFVRFNLTTCTCTMKWYHYHDYIDPPLFIPCIPNCHDYQVHVHVAAFIDRV